MSSSGEDDVPGPANDPELAHACIHFTDGPEIDIWASAEAATAPPAKFYHSRVDVVLPTAPMTQGTFTGWVGFEVTLTATWEFFFTYELPITITDAAGNPVPWLERPILTGICPAVGYAVSATLAPGQYRLQFGPDAVPQFSFVAEERPTYGLVD